MNLTETAQLMRRAATFARAVFEVEEAEARRDTQEKADRVARKLIGEKVTRVCEAMPYL